MHRGAFLCGKQARRKPRLAILNLITWCPKWRKLCIELIRVIVKGPSMASAIWDSFLKLAIEKLVKKQAARSKSASRRSVTAGSDINAWRIGAGSANPVVSIYHPIEFGDLCSLAP
jgi:hypothetical protein